MPTKSDAYCIINFITLVLLFCENLSNFEVGHRVLLVHSCPIIFSLIWDKAPLETSFSKQQAQDEESDRVEECLPPELEWSF